MTTPVATTTCGRVQGIQTDTGLRFAGVPYAEPPVGRLRFRPPEPCRPWTGVRLAEEWGAVSLQGHPTPRPVDGPPLIAHEDCLTLNVHTPAIDSGRRPVMVWIHGGGFTSGSGSMLPVDGGRFARHGDLVVVTINYRLGVTGWLHLGDLDSDLDQSGNVGLLDQVAALEWVRDNIEAFGGDPTRVSLHGVSSGAMTAITLLSLPAAQPLFGRVSAISGAGHNTRSADQANEVAEQVLAAAEVSNVQALRYLSADHLLAAQNKALIRTGLRWRQRPVAGRFLPFGPVLDGIVLSSTPVDAASAGVGTDKALLIGTNHDEWAWFAGVSPPPADLDGLRERLGLLTPDPDALAEPYRARTGDEITPLWIALLTDLFFALPAIRYCEARGPEAETYRYRFDWPSPSTGSVHGLESPFVFDQLEVDNVQAPQLGPTPPLDLARRMHAWWRVFAQGEVLDAEGKWPRYLPDRATMRFGGSDRSGTSDDLVLDPDIRAPWEGLL